jgi:hypothetical protein
VFLAGVLAVRSEICMHVSRSNRQLHFTGVKVFSATMQQDRERIGERITEWLAANRSLVIVDVVVTQSSDEAFHCLAITLLYTSGS